MRAQSGYLSEVRDFQQWMKVQLFENPVLYGLIMGGVWAVLWYAWSGFSNLIGAVGGGVAFGAIMTFVMRWISEPPTPSR